MYNEFGCVHYKAEWQESLGQVISLIQRSVLYADIIRYFYDWIGSPNSLK